MLDQNICEWQNSPGDPELDILLLQKDCFKEKIKGA